MKSINIFSFTRIGVEYSTQYMNMLSAREHKEEVKPWEFQTTKRLVDKLTGLGASIEDLDGFFYSYRINHISKEFDLLKIVPGQLVLNIELKSIDKAKAELEKQLRQNRYYLSHITDNVFLFTYVEETDKLFKYEGNEFSEAHFSELLPVLKLFQGLEYMEEGIEKIFLPKHFLISPLNTPEEFLRGRYFLTNQQQDIEKVILDKIAANPDKALFFGITGSAGTGKTLLLYDLVRRLAGQGKCCCLIHSGILCDGHRYLDSKWQNVDIFPAKQLNTTELSWLDQYSFIMVDESHRIYKSALDKIIKHAGNGRQTVIFSYDYGQWLSYKEKENNIPSYLRAIEGFSEQTLSDTIRTSVEIASFYRNMLDLSDEARGNLDYSDIDILFANDEKEAAKIIRLYRKTYAYTFITYTSSTYKESPFDIYPGNYDTHHVIGQEFDKVMIIMDDNFRYDDDGRIQGKEHPNPDLLFYKLLYQDVSRAREKLCVLIVKNYKLFMQVASIKYSMLEKYQYKISAANAAMSRKKVNKLAKALKDSARTLDVENTLAATENTDIILGELFGAEPRKKIIRNSIRYLRLIQKTCSQKEEFVKKTEEFITYAQQFV